MNRTTCSISAIDPAVADPARSGNITAAAEKKCDVTAIVMSSVQLIFCRRICRRLAELFPRYLPYYLYLPKLGISTGLSPSADRTSREGFLALHGTIEKSDSDLQGPLLRKYGVEVSFRGFAAQDILHME